MLDNNRQPMANLMVMVGDGMFIVKGSSDEVEVEACGGCVEEKLSSMNSGGQTSSTKQRHHKINSTCK